MISEKRLHMLMELLNNRKFVSIQELEENMRVSKSTIRRDLMTLEERGLLLRSRGGACLPERTTEMTQNISEPSLEIRKSMHRDEKQRIAKAALEYIHANDTVLIDAGTTVFELASLLQGFPEPLMVATVDLFSSIEMANNGNIELLLLGGRIRKKHYSTVGHMVEDSLRDIHADIAFISGDAIDLQHGIMSASLDEVAVKRSLISAAREVIALCDSTKFSSVAFVTICDFSTVDCVITDSGIDQKTVKKLKEKGIKVIVV